MRTWVNGELLTDPDAPALAARDHGVTVGDGVFEVLKVVDGRLFAVDLHLERMCRSARGLGLPEPDPDGVRRGMEAVLEGDRFTLGRVRVTWTGGLSPLGSDRGDGPSSSGLKVRPTMGVTFSTSKKLALVLWRSAVSIEPSGAVTSGPPPIPRWT